MQVLNKLFDVIATTPGGTEALMGAGVSETAAALTWQEVAATSAAPLAVPAKGPPSTTITTTKPLPLLRPPRKRVDRRPSYKDR